MAGIIRHLCLTMVLLQRVELKFVCIGLLEHAFTPLDQLLATFKICIDLLIQLALRPDSLVLEAIHLFSSCHLFSSSFVDQASPEQEVVMHLLSLYPHTYLAHHGEHSPDYCIPPPFLAVCARSRSGQALLHLHVMVTISFWQGQSFLGLVLEHGEAFVGAQFSCF